MPSLDAESATAASDRSLVLTRTLDAPRERVFAAWTDPAQFAQWMGPGTIRAEIAALDARVGGAYRIVMHGTPTASGMGAVTGVYREVEPPSRLVFTWAWEHGHESLVTITLRALGSRTELTVRHERLESVSSRDSHQGGWVGCLDKLETYLKAGRA